MSPTEPDAAEPGGRRADGAAHGAQLTLLGELIAGSPHNLLSRRERERVRLHIDESLAVGAVLDLSPGARWLDLGTGGGLPGLPLALHWPDVSFTLVDATRKKADAVAQFARALGLGNVAVRWARAEVLGQEPGFAAAFDGVVARAVADLPRLAGWAAAFLRPGGVLAAIKGPRWEEEMAAFSATAPRTGLVHVHTAAVPAAARPTFVVIMQKPGGS